MGFNPDHIRQLRPVFTAAKPNDRPGMTPLAVQRYWQYYGLDFPELGAIAHRFGYLSSGTFQLACHHWLPEQAQGTVFVLHGYFDHVGIYRHMIAGLLAQQLAVVAFDLPGHGLSSGTPAAIDDFAHYQSALNTVMTSLNGRSPEPWHALAQSTGGAILMDHLLSQPAATPFHKTALLAPLVRPYKWQYGRHLHTLVSPFTPGVKRMFSVNSGDPEFLDFLENKDPLQARYLSARWVSALKRWIPYFLSLPACHHRPLVLQGDKDETVDWRYNLSVIKRKFDRPSVVILPGARHQLANETVNYRDKIMTNVRRLLNE